MKNGVRINACIGACILIGGLFLVKVPTKLTVLKKDIISGQTMQLSANNGSTKSVSFPGGYQLARAFDGRTYGFKETLGKETRYVSILDYLGYTCGYRDCVEAQKLEMTLNGKPLSPTSSFRKLGK